MNQSLRVSTAMGYGILVWFTGFIWGTFVFMTPALKDVPAIPGVSTNPAISFPILAGWFFLTQVISKRVLAVSSNPANDGLRLGAVLVVTNMLLDVLVLVGMLKSGAGMYRTASLWLAYGLLFLIPWKAGTRAS